MNKLKNACESIASVMILIPAWMLISLPAAFVVRLVFDCSYLKAYMCLAAIMFSPLILMVLIGLIALPFIGISMLIEKARERTAPALPSRAEGPMAP